MSEKVFIKVSYILLKWKIKTYQSVLIVNKLADTSISENEFDLINDISDSDRQFLEAMIDLKKKDPIEYQLKLSQFKTQLQQQESNKRIEEDNKPKCPTCGSTNIEKYHLGRKLLVELCLNYLVQM